MEFINCSSASTSKLNKESQNIYSKIGFFSKHFKSNNLKNLSRNRFSNSR